MLAVLTTQMKSAAAGAVYPANPTAPIIWGYSVAEILKVLLDQGLHLGAAYRDELEKAGKIAVDYVVAFDLPILPPGVENTLDEATRAAGYAAIEAIIDAVLGPLTE